MKRKLIRRNKIKYGYKFMMFKLIRSINKKMAEVMGVPYDILWGVK